MFAVLAGIGLRVREMMRAAGWGYPVWRAEKPALCYFWGFFTAEDC